MTKKEVLDFKPGAATCSTRRLTIFLGCRAQQI